MSKKYKTIRAVVECRVPQYVTEKELVWTLKRLLEWPIQVGHPGNTETLVRPSFKQYSRVRAYERRFEDTEPLIDFSNFAQKFGFARRRK